MGHSACCCVAWERDSSGSLLDRFRTASMGRLPSTVTVGDCRRSDSVSLWAMPERYCSVLQSPSQGPIDFQTGDTYMQPTTKHELRKRYAPLSKKKTKRYAQKLPEDHLQSLAALPLYRRTSLSHTEMKLKTISCFNHKAHSNQTEIPASK